MTPMRTIVGREWSGALLTWRGAVLLGTQLLVMSGLALVSLWLPDLSLMGQSGLLILLYQVATILAMVMSGLAGALAIAAERDQATLESLLLTPVASGSLLGAKWLATAGLGALGLLLSLPYLLAMSAGQGISVLPVVAALGLALVLVIGYTGLTVALSALGGRTLGVLTSTIGLAALLEGPGLAAPALGKGALATILGRISPADQVFTLSRLLLTHRPLTGHAGSWIALGVFVLAVVLLVSYAASRLELLGGDA